MCAYCESQSLWNLKRLEVGILMAFDGEFRKEREWSGQLEPRNCIDEISFDVDKGRFDDRGEDEKVTILVFKSAYTFLGIYIPLWLCRVQANCSLFFNFDL